MRAVARKRFFALCAGAWVFAALCLSAAVVIDDFTEGPFSLFVTTVGRTASDTDSGLSPLHTIGGQRDVYLSLQSAGGMATADNGTVPGELLVSQAFNGQAWFRTQYGLGGDMNQDITGSGNEGIYISFQSVGGGGTCAVTVVSSAGSFTVVKAAPSTGTQPMSNLIVPFYFSEFTGVSFLDVDRITVVFTNFPVNTSYSSGLIIAANDSYFLPEPGTALFIALGCLIVVRRRIRFSWGVRQQPAHCPT